MKKIKIAIEDLLAVLQAMFENETKDIIFFEHNGYPAICDADEPESVISFQSVDENGELQDDGETVH